MVDATLRSCSHHRSLVCRTMTATSFLISRSIIFNIEKSPSAFYARLKLNVIGYNFSKIVQK